MIPPRSQKVDATLAAWVNPILTNTLQKRNYRNRPNSRPKPQPLFSPVLQRNHADGKAVFHITPEKSLIGLVDLLDRDHLDVTGDAVGPSEIEHLLRLCDAADEGFGELPTLEDKAESGDGERLAPAEAEGGKGIGRGESGAGFGAHG